MQQENLAEYIKDLESAREEGERRLRAWEASEDADGVAGHRIEKTLQGINEELALADAALEKAGTMPDDYRLP